MEYLALTLPGEFVIEPPSGVPDVSGYTGLSTLFGLALGVFFALGVVVTLLLIAYGAVQWITSGGDKEKIASARKRIIFAILGLMVVFFSVLFINIILNFLGMCTLTESVVYTGGQYECIQN